jgi:hypothetical protein
MNDGLRSGPREALFLGVGLVLGGALVCVGVSFSRRPAEVVMAPPTPTAAAPVPAPAMAAPMPSADETTPPVHRPQVTAPAQGAAPSSRKISVLAPIDARRPKPGPPAPSTRAPPAALKAVRTSSDLPEGLVAHLNRSPRPQRRADVSRLLAHGALSLGDGNARQALGFYATALKLDATNADARFGIALCRWEMGERRTALAVLTQVLAIDPNHPEAAILRGFVAQLAGQTGQAIDWYERAISRLDDQTVVDELHAVVSSLREQSAEQTATARVDTHLH